MSVRDWLVDLMISTMEYHVAPCHGPDSPPPGRSEPIWLHEAQACREMTYTAST